jgi:hypothetical protein
MAMLNSRQGLREQIANVNTADATALRSDGARSFGAPMSLHDRSRGVEITVQHEDFRSDDYKPYCHDNKSLAV